MTIKFASWNVNGIRALAKKPQWQWLRDSDAQIIGLQETKATLKQLDQEIAQPEGWHTYWDSCTVKKGYSGVAAFTRMEPSSVTAQLPDPRFQGEGRLLHLEYPQFHFFTGYFPNGGAPELNEDGVFTGNYKRVPYKLGFLEAFYNLACECAKTKPVVICGDFNIATEAIDVAHPEDTISGFLPVEREWMHKFLAAGFVDSYRHAHGPVAGKYTWWSYQHFSRKRNNGWRIDYFLVSRDLADRITGAWIYDDVHGSDHCPIGLELDI